MRNKTKVIALALVLGACQAPPNTTEGKLAEVVTVINIERLRTGEIRLYVDPETGCEYLLFVAQERGGMTPRLGNNGQPRCKPTPEATRNY